MLNNTATPTPASNNRFSWQNLKSNGKKRKLIVLFGAIIFAAILAFITTKSNLISNPFNPEKGVEVEQIINTETGDLTNDVIENISTVTIDQIKEASESSGINALNSPMLSDTETSKKIYEELGNNDPVNHEIAFSDYGIGNVSIDIKQGDMVTWINTSTAPMQVVGDGWDSIIDRDPGDAFTYTFFFLGEHKYKINGTFEGIVNVGGQ